MDLTIQAFRDWESKSPTPECGCSWHLATCKWLNLMSYSKVKAESFQPGSMGRKHGSSTLHLITNPLGPAIMTNRRCSFEDPKIPKQVQFVSIRIFVLSSTISCPATAPARSDKCTTGDGGMGEVGDVACSSSGSIGRLWTVSTAYATLLDQQPLASSAVACNLARQACRCSMHPRPSIPRRLLWDNVETFALCACVQCAVECTLQAG